MGHIKILKISKETPKDVPETLYGQYRHYGCGGTGGWTWGGGDGHARRGGRGTGGGRSTEMLDKITKL